MDEQEVRFLLGDPDYEPARGNFYYYSEKMKFSSDAEMMMPMGLAVSFRDPDIDSYTSDPVTNKLHGIYFGIIGE